MSDADTNEPKSGESTIAITATTSGADVTYTTAPPEEKKKKSTTNNNNNNNNKRTSDAVGKVSKAEIEKSLYRKKWIDRIATFLLTSALVVYFIILVFSIISASNATVVEKEDNEKEMEAPAIYLEFLRDDESSVTVNCEFTVYLDDKDVYEGKFEGKDYKEEKNEQGWSVLELTKYNYTGVILTPPDDSMIKVERTVTNRVETTCDVAEVTINLNFYHTGQYEQYEDDEQELADTVAYDSLDSKLGYETDYDLEWYTVSDELTLAAKPPDLEGIDGSYDYYEMSLSGIYTLGTGEELKTKTGFSCYRKHTNYVYQDSTSFGDIIAAVGGMYTSLATILAWFLVKFVWGYDFKIYTWQLYKWTGYAPHAPRNPNQGAGEKNEGEDEEDGGADL